MDDAKARAWRERAHKASEYDDITDWAVTFHLGDREASNYSYERWQSTKSLPWLVSTLVTTQASYGHALASAE